MIDFVLEGFSRGHLYFSCKKFKAAGLEITSIL